MNLLILFIFGFAAIRGLRWLAIIQQKEYRFDRLRLFVQSSEGQRELTKFKYSLTDLSRKGLKRPVLTARIALVTVILAFLSLLLLWLALFVGEAGGFVLSLLVFFGMPLLVMLAVLPSAILSGMKKQWVIRKAKDMVNRNSPLVIGITGSYGKTSTKKIAAHLLEPSFKVFATPASYNTLYSVSKSIVDHYRNEEVCLLEFGAYTPGEIARLCEAFQPKIAIITGVSDQHVGLFGSLENLMKAKHELVEGVPEDGVVFANGQDDQVRQMLKDDVKQILWYGTKEELKKANVKVAETGELLLQMNGRQLKVPLIGRHYATNLLGAIALARHLKVTNDRIIEQLEKLPSDNAFVSIAWLKSGGLLVDDGKSANRVGVEAVYQLVADLKPKRAILAFAGIVDLGNQSRPVHAGLARGAKEVFEEVWYLGSEGLEQFSEVWGERLHKEGEGLVERAAGLTKGEVLVLEGRLPKSIEKRLKQLKVDS